MIPISQMISWLSPPDLRLVDWPAHIFCSRNFALIVSTSDSAQDEYLRPLTSLLVFPGGVVLLISEREADAILKLLWQKRSSRVYLLHLAYVRVSFDNSNASIALGLPTAPRVSIIDERTLTALQLLNGETSYNTETRKKHLYALIDTNTAGHGPPKLVRMRGLQHYLHCSDLERTCERSMRSARKAYSPFDAGVAPAPAGVVAAPAVGGGFGAAVPAMTAGNPPFQGTEEQASNAAPDRRTELNKAANQHAQVKRREEHGAGEERAGQPTGTAAPVPR